MGVNVKVAVGGVFTQGPSYYQQNRLFGKIVPDKNHLSLGESYSIGLLVPLENNLSGI